MQGYLEPRFKSVHYMPDTVNDYREDGSFVGRGGKKS